MKKIRYIVELAFIFLLPLLFLVCRITLSKNFSYDNELLTEVEEGFDYTPITYLSQQETITTYEFTHYTTWNFSAYTGDIYMAYNDFIYDVGFGASMLAWNGSDKENISVYLADATTIIFNDEAYYQYHEETCTIVVIDGIDYYKVSVSNFTYDIPNEEWQAFNRGYYLYAENTETITHYSPIITVKNLLADLILVDSNDVSYNIVFDYTCLWFLMFIIWHLIYLFVDFLLHFWHKRRD